MKRNLTHFIACIACAGAFALTPVANIGLAQVPPTPIRGVNGGVHAIAVDQFGNIYVGGSFTQAGDVYANNIARWNPFTRTWTKLDTPPPSQGTDGVSGSDAVVKSIVCHSDGKIYVGGRFQSAGGLSARNVAVYNPTAMTWENLGGGVYDNTEPNSSVVNSIAIDNYGQMYVGGAFSRAGGIPSVPSTSISALNLARFNLTTLQWQKSCDPPLAVEKVRYRPDVIRFCGSGGVYELRFTPESVSYYVTKYPVYGTVKDFLQFGYSDFYIYGGYFKLEPSGSYVNLAYHYSPYLINGPMGNNYIYALSSITPDWTFTFAGILDFVVTDGIDAWQANNVAQVNASRPGFWSVLGVGEQNGVDGPAYSLNSVPVGENVFVYVGGEFMHAGGDICANNIAVWDTTNNTWSALSPNAAPVVSITSPANGSFLPAPASITVTANASDDCKVVKVDFYDGNTLLGTDTDAPYSFALGISTPGVHTFTAKATDNEGLETISSPVTVTIMCTPPTVSITGPSDGSIYQSPANITISATATDPDGSVAKVQFYQGNTLLAEDSTAPYSFTWNGVTAGTYLLTARAVDNLGCVGMSQSAVVVRVDPFLLDLDFGGIGGYMGPSTKTGLAATGQTPTDFWNFYAGPNLNFGALSNLKLANGTVTSIGMTVANAPGNWGYFSSDPMYYDYIYRQGANATITVTNLPTGNYDVYLYGMDGKYEISAGGVNYGSKTSYDSPMVNPPTWQEGKQYALFKTVALSIPGQPISISVQPGQGGYSLISGLQIAPAFLIDVDFGGIGGYTGPSTKVGFAATGQTTNDFWNFYSGPSLNFGVLPNLKLADGNVTSVGMTVANAPGNWGYFSSDPMYFDYIYRQSANATITVTNLPVGNYDLYLYGMDGKYQVSTGGVDYGTKTSYDSPMNNPPVWQSGKQYALFKGVAVTATGQSVTISVQPGQGGYSLISGLQIAPATR